MLEIATCALDGTRHVEVVSRPANLSGYDVTLRALTPTGTFLTEIEKRKPDDIPVDTGEAETITEKCSCELAELSTEGGKPARRYSPCLPQVTKVTQQEIVFAPNCDRIGWLVTRHYEPTGFPLLKQLRARLGDKPHQETAIWVSKLDGIDAHEIGHVAHKPDESRPQQLAWLPGGKQLSFNYKGDLYIVPAN